MSASLLTRPAVGAEEADYSHSYDPDLDFDAWYTVFAARRIARRLAPGATVLEIGSATGGLTRHLVGQGRRFTCVERSAPYLERARARALPGVALHHASLETFDAPERFAHVLAVSVLHEVAGQLVALRRLRDWLTPGGLLHVTLPNPMSLHRLSAYGAGMIEDLCSLSERGRRFGTRRLQTAESFVARAAGLGLREVAREAILPKPLPNEAMAKLSDELIEAWGALSEALPEHGAMTYFVLRHG